MSLLDLCSIITDSWSS